MLYEQIASFPFDILGYLTAVIRGVENIYDRLTLIKAELGRQIGAEGAGFGIFKIGKALLRKPALSSVAYQP